MDTDWCLACGCRLDINAAYCSKECLNNDSSFSPNSPSQSHDDDSNSDSLDDVDWFYPDESPAVSQWAGKDHAGILAWAGEIPSDAALSDDGLSTHRSYSSLRPPTFPVSRQRPVPPKLCTSTTQPSRPNNPSPSRPISARRHTTHLHRHSLTDGSLTSLLTDSIATPTSTADDELIPHPTMLCAFVTHVRSWVHPHAPVEHQKEIDALFPPRPTAADEYLLMRPNLRRLSDDFGVYPDVDQPRTVRVSAGEHAGKDRPPLRSPSLRPHDPNHPVYHTRGRKPSRALARDS